MCGCIYTCMDGGHAPHPARMQQTAALAAIDRKVDAARAELKGKLDELPDAAVGAELNVLDPGPGSVCPMGQLPKDGARGSNTQFSFCQCFCSFMVLRVCLFLAKCLAEAEHKYLHRIQQRQIFFWFVFFWFLAYSGFLPFCVHIVCLRAGAAVGVRPALDSSLRVQILKSS